MKKFNSAKKGRGALSAIPFILVTVLLASCATAPRVPAPVTDDDLPELAILPAGGRLYLWADTVTARPLLDILSFEGFSGRDAAMVLDRTGTAAAVLFPDGYDRRFFLAATGRYPRHRANVSFACSRAWRRQRSSDRRTFWYSRNNGIAVALGPRLALVSNKDPFEDFVREIPPPAFSEFRQGMALAGWISNPSETINDLLEAMGIPIQLPAEDFFFGAIRSPIGPGMEESAAPWELAFRIRTPSELHARSLLIVFSMARAFILQGAAGETLGGARIYTEAGSLSLQEATMMLFANAPEQDGAFLTLRINSLDPGRMALLFNMFSVYSNH